MTADTTIDPADLGVTDDPGTSWHPDKPEAYDADGHLVDLTADQVVEHLAKPEGLTQPDGGARSLAAEDSAHTSEGVL